MDYDGPKVYRDEKRIARKPHRCCECEGVIFFKELYYVFSGLWDSWETHKTCQHCQQLRDAQTDRHDICFGDLQSHIFDGGYKPDIKFMISNMDSRGSRVQPWMREMVK